MHSDPRQRYKIKDSDMGETKGLLEPPGKSEAEIESEILNYYSQREQRVVDLRFLVLGCSWTGKSSIIKRIVYSDLVETFKEVKQYEKIQETKGAEIHIQHLKTEDATQTIKVTISSTLHSL